MFLNVCKQTFRISHVRRSQKVNGVLMWNLQRIIFIWRRIYWQIFKFAIVYRCVPLRIFAWDQSNINYKVSRSFNFSDFFAPAIFEVFKYLMFINETCQIIANISLRFLIPKMGQETTLHFQSWPTYPEIRLEENVIKN